MNSFLARTSRVAVMLILINAIHSQVAGTTTAMSAKMTNKVLNIGNLTLKRYNPKLDLEPEQVSNTSTTVISLPTTRKNYLPKNLASWPSILSNLYKIGGNVVGLYPGVNKDLILPLEPANKTLPNASVTPTPIRAIVTELAAILTHARDVKGPRLYNNTINMLDIPPFLEAQFLSYKSGLKLALSDITRNKAYLDNLDQDMISDVEYIITKGAFEVDTHNATLIANEFYSKKLPLFVEVSNTIEKKMAETRTLQEQVRAVIEKGMVEFKKRLTLRKDQISARTTEWTDEVMTVWNATETFINDYVTVIRNRKPSVRDTFDTMWAAHCNPSNDLLDAAIKHVKEWTAAEVGVANYLKASSTNVTHAVIKELDSRQTIALSGLKKGLTCIDEIDTKHGADIRDIISNYFLTGTNKVDTILTDGYTALNTLVASANAVILEQSTALRTLASTAPAPDNGLALGVLLDTGMNFLGELSPVFFGRREVIYQEIVLTSNNLFQVDGAKLSQYQAFMFNPPVMYTRRVVPQLLDEVDNSGLPDYSPEVGSTTLPTTTPLPSDYTAAVLVASGKTASVLLPMCYDADTITNNIMPLVPVHDYGVYTHVIPISNFNYTDNPSVTFKLTWASVIPPVVFKKTPKDFTLIVPFETNAGKLFNGYYNFVRAVSLQNTNMGIVVVITVGDVNQFEEMLRMKEKPQLAVTIIPNEKPY